MNAEDIYLKACRQIGAYFQKKDFTASENGLILNKFLEDKSVNFRISFQSSCFNKDSNVNLWAYVHINSQSVKKFKSDILHEESSDIVWTERLTNIIPVKKDRWNVGGENFDKTVNEITSLLDEYALPIFDLFEDKDKSVSFIKEYGCLFNSYIKNDSLSALGYMLLYGSKEEAEEYFIGYYSRSKDKKKIAQFFEKLKSEDDINSVNNGFLDVSNLKLGYFCGLKLNR